MLELSIFNVRKENMIDLKAHIPCKYNFDYKNEQLYFFTSENDLPFAWITLYNLKYSYTTRLSKIITSILLGAALILLLITIFAFGLWIYIDKTRSGIFKLVIQALMIMAIPAISIIKNEFGISEFLDFASSILDFG